jgi:hypothetical protein
MTASPHKKWRIDTASHLKGVRLQFRRYPKGACYEWVCQTCFDDLKDDMQWSAANG